MNEKNTDNLTSDIVSQLQTTSTQIGTMQQQQQPWDPPLVKTLVWTTLGFGLLTLILVTFILRKTNASASHTLRIFGILSIIIFSVVVVIVGYNQAQLTPVLGLFGAIAGYLLGKDSNESKTFRSANSTPQDKNTEI